MMDLQHIGRLKEEQWRALAETEEKLTQWLEKFKSDYTALKERLETLPDKVTHDVMVPFGSMAFMPGQLIHTNEIMVLLGDNWFVERSAKQAAEIVDRRIAGVDVQIKDLQRQKKLLEPRLQFASELTNPSQEEQYFEITEEYNPEKEKAWKEQHKNNVQKYRKILKEEERKKEEGGKDVTDEDLWARLDQLEMIEAENKEMENLSDEETEVTSGDRKEQQKSFSISHDRRVHWKDLQTGDTDSGEESDREDSDDYDDEEEQEAELLQPTRRINFTHTNVLSQQVTEINTYSSADKTEEPVVQNPGDIFRIYGWKNDNRSILKQSTTSKDGTKQKVETGSMSKGATSAVAFSGKVIEKQSSAGLGPTSLTDSGNITEKPKPVEQPKRVSKFRAQRQKIHEPS